MYDGHKRSVGTAVEYLETHPRAIGVSFTTLLLLTEAGSTAAAIGGTIG